MKRPLLIGIGGAHSGVGKTTLAVGILKHLEACPPACLSSHPPKLGGIKYTKTALYASVIDDKTILCQKNKDTKRMLDAGAEEVLWVQSPQTELEEVLPLAVSRLSHLDCIIIEGNSAIEFLNPNIVLFVTGYSARMKPSARAILNLAHIVLVRNKEHSADCLENVSTAPICLTADSFDKNTIEKIVNSINSIAMKNEIENLIQQKSADGGLACSEARKIAEELEVPYKEVGQTANKLKIKIKNCELGCF